MSPISKGFHKKNLTLFGIIWGIYASWIVQIVAKNANTSRRYATSCIFLCSWRFSKKRYFNFVWKFPLILNKMHSALPVRQSHNTMWSSTAWRLQYCSYITTHQGLRVLFGDRGSWSAVIRVITAGCVFIVLLLSVFVPLIMSKVKRAKVTNSRMEIWCGYRTKDGAECGYPCPNYHRARLVKHTKKHHPSESDILIRGSAAWVSVH